MENRYIKALQSKLMPRLESETESLRKGFPERTFRFWGQPYGPPDFRQRFGAGITTDTHSLVIDVSEVRFMPCVTVTLHSEDGGVSGSAIWAKPLGSLRDLPQMLRFFRAALQGSEAPELPFPFVTFGDRDDLEGSPLSSDLEMKIIISAADYLKKRHGVTVPAVDLGAEGSPGSSPDWVEAAGAYLTGPLPGLQAQTVRSYYQQKPPARLLDSSSLAVFSPRDDRAEVSWAEYFLKYPQAPGRLRFTRPGCNPGGDQALLSVRLVCEPEFTRAVANTPSYGQADGPFHLLLLLDKDQTWQVSAECDETTVAAAVDDQVRLRHLRSWFSRPEIAACLGLQSVAVEAFCEGRYDLELRRGGWSRQVAILEQSWVRQQAQEEIYTVDRPVAIVADLDNDTAMMALLQMLEPWEEEIRRG